MPSYVPWLKLIIVVKVIHLIVGIQTAWSSKPKHTPGLTTIPNAGNAIMLAQTPLWYVWSPGTGGLSSGVGLLRAEFNLVCQVMDSGWWSPFPFDMVVI